MLRLLRALTARTHPRGRAPSDSRDQCVRCGRSFTQVDELHPDVYCWWCATHHAKPDADPYQGLQQPE